ncbi:MAG TPA: hypothetical protein VKX17_20865 [Planctomycetota bacterium]|nr:hypothetical protein [Planctomycetota bacterium]
MTTLEEKPPVLKFDEVKPLNPQEIAASARVLMYFARADGSFSPEEKEVLQESFQGMTLPAGVTFESLYTPVINLDEELRKIASTEGRERTYNAAYSLAYAEGPCPPEKEKLLDHIREGLHIDADRASLTGRIYADARDWLVPGTINPIADPSKREQAVNECILRLSIVTALAGAVAVPVLSVITDMLVVSIQVKLVRDIGQYWGHKVDREAARSIIASILGAAGIRIAVHSLVNLIPFMGIAVGAASSFITTWAVGKVANQYFASGGQLESEDLRKLYQEAKLEAKTAYEKSKDAVAKVAGKRAEDKH